MLMRLLGVMRPFQQAHLINYVTCDLCTCILGFGCQRWSCIQGSVLTSVPINPN